MRPVWPSRHPRHCRPPASKWLTRGTRVPCAGVDLTHREVVHMIEEADEDG